MWQLALALGLIRQLSLAIVVERNMFAYYKVPASQLLYAQDSNANSDSDSIFDIDADFTFRDTFNRANGQEANDLFYVLQCPPKLEDAIPKPQDMQTCSLVDQYRGMFQKKPTKPKKRLHMVPFRIVLRPLGPPTKRRSLKRRKRQHKDVPKAPHEKVAAEKMENEVEEAEAELVSSPLQYLGRPHARQKLLKLAADHKNFKRGNSSKGYQHMYHRDETYNDHIFYDELHTDGEFHNYGKEKSN